MRGGCHLAACVAGDCARRGAPAFRPAAARRPCPHRCPDEGPVPAMWDVQASSGGQMTCAADVIWPRALPGITLGVALLLSVRPELEDPALIAAPMRVPYPRCGMFRRLRVAK